MQIKTDESKPSFANILPLCAQNFWRAHAKQKRADAYKAQVGLFAAGHDYEEQVAKVIEITHVKEYHDDEGERVA